ncbi:MAG: cupin domain-containing protein [Candidatus Promineifilaceae bacterium]|jgi:quercetin dioxygenase-like cupin family protein
MNGKQTSYTAVEDLDALVGETPEASIVSRTVFKDESVRVILFAFAPGEKLSEHTSSYPAILHFLSGDAALTLGKEMMDAGPDTWVHMAANLPHSVEARTEVHMLLTMLVAAQ